MLTFAFIATDPILPGKYLLGSPTWEVPIDLLTARITATVGASNDPTVFGLEVGGVLSDTTFTILPLIQGQRINLVFRIDKKIDADTEIRVKCLSGPTDGLSQIGFNLNALEASTLTQTPGEMFVRWVNGLENVRILEYDPTTHLFTETTSGISSGRATIDNAATFLATVGGSTAAQSNGSQQIKTNEWICNGSTGTQESPRIEFWIGEQRIASLTKTGKFYVQDVVETATPSAASTRFALYGSGVLAATLGPLTDGGPNILSGVELCEPAT